MNILVSEYQPNEMMKATEVFIKGLERAKESKMESEFLYSFFQDIMDSEKVKCIYTPGETIKQFEESIQHAIREWDI